VLGGGVPRRAHHSGSGRRPYARYPRGVGGEQRPDEPGAREAAFADAHAHAAVHAEILPIEVVPDVFYPLDKP
jgi:hypothetical protein